MAMSEEACVSRGRYLSVEEGFNVERPALAPCDFQRERELGVSADKASGVVELDSGADPGSKRPATSPLMLASFVRIRPGDMVTVQARATGTIFYVCRGAGRSSWNAGALAWRQGDLFCLPGGGSVEHSAGSDDCLLYAVSDQPALDFAGLRPAPWAEAPVEPVHYPAARLAEQLEALGSRSIDAETAGRALFLSSARMEGRRTCLPMLTATLNLVLPGERQRPHKHNAAAIVFVIRGGGVQSRIGERVFRWTEHAVLLTPPLSVHSHENAGDAPGVALIVQDGGLHYHARTMGFAFA